MLSALLPRKWVYGGGCVRPPRAGARGRFVSLPRGDVHVMEWEPEGEPEGQETETIIAVHGFLGSCRFWSESCCSRCALGPFLAHCGFRVVAFDLYGFGHSDAPDPAEELYTQDFYVAQFWSLVEALGLPKIHILAHSMGAVIGLAAALRCPTRVLTAVLHAPALHSPVFERLDRLVRVMPILLRVFAAVTFKELVGDVNDENPAILRTVRSVIEGRSVSRSSMHRWSGVPKAFGRRGPATVTESQDGVQDRLTILAPNKDGLVPFSSIMRFRNVCAPRCVLHVMDGADHPSLTEVGSNLHLQVCALAEAAFRGKRSWVSTFHLPDGVPHGCHLNEEQVKKILIELRLPAEFESVSRNENGVKFPRRLVLLHTLLAVILVLLCVDARVTKQNLTLFYIELVLSLINVSRLALVCITYKSTEFIDHLCRKNVRPEDPARAGREHARASADLFGLGAARAAANDFRTAALEMIPLKKHRGSPPGAVWPSPQMTSTFTV